MLIVPASFQKFSLSAGDGLAVVQHRVPARREAALSFLAAS